MKSTVLELDVAEVSQSDDVSVGHRSVALVDVGHATVDKSEKVSDEEVGQSSQSMSGSQVGVIVGHLSVVVSVGDSHECVVVGNARSELVVVARHNAYP